MPKHWVESTSDKSAIAVANSAVLRYDLFRDIFVLGPNNSVKRAEINERFDIQEAVKGLIDGKYIIRLRGPGMMGPYLKDAEGGGSMLDIVGLQNGLEYWVEVEPDLESTSLELEPAVTVSVEEEAAAEPAEEPAEEPTPARDLIVVDATNI